MECTNSASTYPSTAYGPSGGLPMTMIGWWWSSLSRRLRLPSLGLRQCLTWDANGVARVTLSPVSLPTLTTYPIKRVSHC